MAFIFEGRSYQFKRLPFGLVNSVAVFIKCMYQVLGQEALQFTTIYVDDLLITSANWEDHCCRIEHVLRKLSENNITLKTREVKIYSYRSTVFRVPLIRAWNNPIKRQGRINPTIPNPEKQKTVTVVLRSV